MFKKIAMTLAVSGFVFSTFTPLVISDADAKSYGSRSFSSSSYSRSSYRSSSSSSSKSSSSRKMFSSWSSKPKKSSVSSSKKYSTKSTGTTSTNGTTNSKKFTTNNSKVTSSKTGGTAKKSSSFKTVSAGKQTRNAKSALKSQRNKFKKPSYVKSSGAGGGKTSSSTYRTKYGSNPTYARAARYDRSTYYSRRNQHYSGYNAPTYVYNSSPSYGMWDTIFLYSMMSNMNNNNASQFAYNHQNDADYQQWRREADKLSQDNAELRAQLAQIDAGQSKYAGKPINASYIPEGVDADLAMSQEVLSAQKPTMRVCVGSKNGTYFRVTAGVLMQSINSVNIVPVLTHGTGEILTKVTNGQCDAGFVQADGYWNYVEDKQVGKLPFERVSSPYKEAVHLICNEDGPSHISELTAKNKVWFPAGSGAAETWRNFVGEDDDYGKVQTSLTNPAMKVETYTDAVMKAKNDKNSCALYVGAPGASKFMKNIDSAAKQSNIVLIGINDNDLNDTTDPSGRAVYKFSNLKNYKQLNRQASCYGYCAGDVETLLVSADFIVANKWKAANSSAYSSFALDMMGVQPEIKVATKF